MKNTPFKTIKLLSMVLVIAALAFLASCKEDDPKKEDTPELITKATLTFTPPGGGAAVVVTATDPDGEGVRELTVDGPINLVKSTSYTLTISLINGLVAVTEPEYNVTDEVEEEGDEHMFFFSWTNNVFAEPSGNGNIDNRPDAVLYTGGANSVDVNGRPLGITTSWVSASASASGQFRVLLKHQPDLKSDTSTSNTGETDLDITFSVVIL